MDLTSQTSEHLAWDTEDNALRGAIAARLHRTLRHKRFIPATATRWFVASEHEAKLSRREITVPPHQAVRRLAGPPDVDVHRLCTGQGKAIAATTP